MLLRFLYVLPAFCLWAQASPAATADDAISVGEVTRLIRAAEKNVKEANGWAIDLMDVLEAHELPQNKENVCSAIAIIDQESGFVADPEVKGLGRISEKAIRQKLDKIPVVGRTILQFLETNPENSSSYMQRIREARTERDLDMTYRALVADAAKQTSLSIVLNSGLMNSMVEDRNEIDTIGSMQVSVNFALKEKKRRRLLPMGLDDVYALRDELYTRRGGMYYGALLLLGYETGYSKKLYRFADFNAGRYASRNAAFQRQIAALTSDNLAPDGDLLLYTDEKPRATPSSTEKALRKAAQRYNLGLSEDSIRGDLLREKEMDFIKTKTFTAVRAAYEEKTNKKPDFAEVPSIALNSPKITSNMTTKKFAETVNRRYQACMAKR